jgi:hypothetical protein
MSKFEQCHRNAEEAQRQADRATSDEIRAAWLELVRGWLALLPKREENEPSTFSRVRGLSTSTLSDSLPEAPEPWDDGGRRKSRIPAAPIRLRSSLNLYDGSREIAGACAISAGGVISLDLVGKSSCEK